MYLPAKFRFQGLADGAIDWVAEFEVTGLSCFGEIVAWRMPAEWCGVGWMRWVDFDLVWIFGFGIGFQFGFGLIMT